MKRVKLFFLIKFFFLGKGEDGGGGEGGDFTAPMMNRVNKRLGFELQICGKTWNLEEVQKLEYS